MGGRADAVADQFDLASRDFLARVTALSAAQWTEPLRDGDPRPAGVVAHHVADGYAATSQALQGLLAGMDLGLTWDIIHGGNAAHAAAHHGVTRDETLALLRSHGIQTLTMLRGLEDAQLDQLVSFPLFGDAPMPAQAVIDGLVIGHIGMHAPDFPLDA